MKYCGNCKYFKKFEEQYNSNLVEGICTRDYELTDSNKRTYITYLIVKDKTEACDGYEE